MNEQYNWRPAQANLQVCSTAGKTFHFKTKPATAAVTPFFMRNEKSKGLSVFY
jgi:hypothetical protein